MVQITQKAGVDGKLFGSVTNSDIAEALKAQGFDVPKAAIRMPAGPIKQVGDQQFKVALHTDGVVTITGSVLGEAAERFNRNRNFLDEKRAGDSPFFLVNCPVLYALPAVIPA